MNGEGPLGMKRNLVRFPAEFMFQLSESEMDELIANCDRFKTMKHSRKERACHGDAYPEVATLDILAKRGRGVKVELITHSDGELKESDFEAFGKQCGKFTKSICGICHD